METLLQNHYETLQEDGFFEDLPSSPKNNSSLLYKKWSPLIDDTKRLTCEYCEKTFISKKTYNKHVKYQHKDIGAVPDPYKKDPTGTCELILRNSIESKVCGAKLPTSYFIEHLKTQHEIQKPDLKYFWGFELTHRTPVFLFKTDNEPAPLLNDKNIGQNINRTENTASIINEIHDNPEVEENHIDNNLENKLNSIEERTTNQILEKTFNNTMPTTSGILNSESNNKLEHEIQKHTFNSTYQQPVNSDSINNTSNLSTNTKEKDNTNELINNLDEIEKKNQNDNNEQIKNLKLIVNPRMSIPSTYKILCPVVENNNSENGNFQNESIPLNLNDSAFNNILTSDISLTNIDDYLMDEIDLNATLFESQEPQQNSLSKIQDCVNNLINDTNIWNKINLKKSISLTNIKSPNTKTNKFKKHNSMDSKLKVTYHMDENSNKITNLTKKKKTAKRKLNFFLENIEEEEDFPTFDNTFISYLEKEIEENYDSDYDDNDKDNYTLKRRENKSTRHEKRNNYIHDFYKRKENSDFIDQMKDFLKNQIIDTTNKSPSTIKKTLGHLFFYKDSLLVYRINANKKYKLSQFLRFDCKQYKHLQFPGNWLDDTVQENGYKGSERLKAHSDLRKFILNQAQYIENLELRIKIRENMEEIEKQIKKEKRYKKYEKKAKLTKMKIDNAKIIIDASQQHKAQHIVKLWNDSNIKKELDSENKKIYENAIKSKKISGKNFTKYSQWVRFNVFMADKGRSSVYGFNNEQFISRIKMWFPESYIEYNELPPSYDPYIKPTGDPEPTNYVIRISGDKESSKNQDPHSIILTKKTYNLCAQYRELKEDILNLDINSTSAFFVNHKNKPLTRIQNTKNSLLQKVEMATGVDNVTTNTIRRAAETRIQSRTDMQARCKTLNSHSSDVGRIFYDKADTRFRAEFVNYSDNIEKMSTDDCASDTDEDYYQKAEKRRRIDEEDLTKSVEKAKETLNEYRLNKKLNSNMNLTKKIKSADRLFLQKLIFEECFDSNLQLFPNNNNWKITLNRLIDSYDKDKGKRETLLRIERDIFFNIKEDVENTFNQEWSGTKEENSEADFQVAKAVQKILEDYEKDKNKSKSYFMFK